MSLRWAENMSSRLSAAMTLSIAAHSLLLFGIGFALPNLNKSAHLSPPLQVVLVNSKSKSAPLKADALAQANLDGGGNTAEKLRAQTALPTISDDRQFTSEQVARRFAELENESRRLMTQLKSDFTVSRPTPKKERSPDSRNGEDLVQRSLEIARLEAQISKTNSTLQEMPRRTRIGARAKEYRFAQYVEDWRIKVERVGNLNYPEEARRRQIFGKLVLMVSIKANGTLEKVEVSRSSGHRLLDAAAVRIVKLAAPYAPLPPEITRDTDILTIVRTWTFTTSDKLESD